MADPLPNDVIELDPVRPIRPSAALRHLANSNHRKPWTAKSLRWGMTRTPSPYTTNLRHTPDICRRQSYTTSLKSSILEYKYENGRRYHAEFKDKGTVAAHFVLRLLTSMPQAYYLPNDERELDRLDLYHHIVLLRCDGNLHLAPIGKSPQRILDIGAGTGIWAIEMAEMNPSAEVRYSQTEERLTKN